MTPTLRIASDADTETLAQRIQRLQGELKSLGRQQVDQMRAEVMGGIGAAQAVISNHAQPEGVRQLAEKIVRDSESLLQTLDQIVGRTSA